MITSRSQRWRTTYSWRQVVLHDGVVESVERERIVVLADGDAGVDIYNLVKPEHSNQTFIIRHRSIVVKGERVMKGDILADIREVQRQPVSSKSPHQPKPRDDSGKGQGGEGASSSTLDTIALRRKADVAATKEPLQEREEAISPGPPPGRPPLPEKRKALILEALKHDPNFARVGRKFGVSDMTVSRIAKQAKMKAGQQKGMRVSPEKRVQVLEALEHLNSFRAVAAEVGGISYKTVAKIAEEKDWKRPLARPQQPLPRSEHG